MSESTVSRWPVGCALLAASSAACASHPCFEDDYDASLSVGGTANGLMSDTPDAYVGGPWEAYISELGQTCLDGGCPAVLGFMIFGPDGIMNIAFNVPPEAGAYLFEDLVTSESLDPVPAFVTLGPISRSEGGISSDGSTDDLDGSTDEASVPPLIPLALTGTVEISSNAFGQCNSSVGCLYNYAGRMSLVDTARGIAALNIAWTQSNSEIPIGMCADNSSGDVPSF